VFGFPGRCGRATHCALSPHPPPSLSVLTDLNSVFIYGASAYSRGTMGLHSQAVSPQLPYLALACP